MIEYLTTETEAGLAALKQVMNEAYIADFEGLAPEWVRVMIADGEPVAFIIIDTEKELAFSRGKVRYAFIRDVATSERHRYKGHFRGIMEDTFDLLKAEKIPAVITHGTWQLYRRFGFDVFTHHCGIFITPEQIRRHLGEQKPGKWRLLLEIDQGQGIREDILLISKCRAFTMTECREALKSAADIAIEQGKNGILFEHPHAPSYGSEYPIYASPMTHLYTLARSCGGEMRLLGADPESGTIPDGDWIKVLDMFEFLKNVVKNIKQPADPLPETTVCFETDAGTATIVSAAGQLTVFDGKWDSKVILQWPSADVAQLVTGFLTAGILCARKEIHIPNKALRLLQKIFPRQWRFSRNESWIYRS